MSSSVAHYADAVASLLAKMGWLRDSDMEPTGGGPRCPVYAKQYRKCELKCVVGPLWTTYYRLVKDTIFDQDSTRTLDLETLRVELSKLMFLAKE